MYWNLGQEFSLILQVRLLGNATGNSSIFGVDQPAGCADEELHLRFSYLCRLPMTLYSITRLFFYRQDRMRWELLDS